MRFCRTIVIMDKFEHFSLGRIVFGRGRFSCVGETACRFGSTALVVHSGPEPEDRNMTGRLASLLAAAKVRGTFLRQQGEPQVGDVDAGVAMALRERCDLVIGLGGGSAIDAAKAIAGLVTNGGSAIDYMEVIGKGLKITRPALPWIAIPTTAGTGAEATRNAVIGCAQKQFKASIRSEHLLPAAALIDPELGVSVPPEVTARSGMDALCQLMESYTSTGAQPITDALALKGVSLAAGSLARAYHNGADIEAREDMALAALLSGITLGNAGLGAVHGFAAPLGAKFPVPHGTACAALLPHVIRANVKALREQSPDHPALARYATLGRVLADDNGLSAPAAIEVCVTFTSAMSRELNIPPLRNFGLSVSDVPEMVAMSRKSSSMRFNPVVLSDAALGEALAAAIIG